MKITAVTLSAASFVAVVVACGGSPSTSGFENPGSSGSSSSGSSGAGASSGTSGTFNGNGGGTPAGTNCSDTSAGDLHSCGCSGDGTTRACWTVDPTRRNGNGCHDGAQTCQKQGEFSQWGACTGEVTTCATGVTGADAGTAAPPPPPANCTCMPGAVRWCDTPVACNWGKQACNPDGTWGTCNETNERPANCNDPLDPSFDETCCLTAGQCCQDIDSLDDDQKSKGNCAQIACASDIAK